MANHEDQKNQGVRTGKNADAGLTTPHGPHYSDPDNTAGGGDSSPFETLSSGEQARAVRQAKDEETRRNPGKEAE